MRWSMKWCGMMTSDKSSAVQRICATALFLCLGVVLLLSALDWGGSFASNKSAYVQMDYQCAVLLSKILASCQHLGANRTCNSWEDLQEVAAKLKCGAAFGRISRSRWQFVSPDACNREIPLVMVGKEADEYSMIWAVTSTGFVIKVKAEDFLAPKNRPRGSASYD